MLSACIAKIFFKFFSCLEAETQKISPMKNNEPGDDDDLPATQR